MNQKIRKDIAMPVMAFFIFAGLSTCALLGVCVFIESIGYLEFRIPEAVGGYNFESYRIGFGLYFSVLLIIALMFFGAGAAFYNLSGIGHPARAIERVQLGSTAIKYALDLQEKIRQDPVLIQEIKKLANSL